MVEDEPGKNSFTMLRRYDEGMCVYYVEAMIIIVVIIILVCGGGCGCRGCPRYWGEGEMVPFRECAKI